MSDNRDDKYLIAACNTQFESVNRLVAELRAAVEGTLALGAEDLLDLSETLEYRARELEAPPDLFIAEERLATLQQVDDLADATSVARWADAIESLEHIDALLDEDAYRETGRHSQEGSDSARWIDNILDQLIDHIDFLSGAEYTRLYVDQVETILAAESFITVERKVAEAIVSNPQILDSMDPRYFEELIATLYSSLGLDVFLTQRTRDGGRDIVAVGHKANAVLKFIIECKRFRRDRRVGVSYVRQLYGVKQSEGASKAILATTAEFSQPAREFAQKHIWELELVGYTRLLSMLRKYARAGRGP